jgi:hypothetical protein
MIPKDGFIAGPPNWSFFLAMADDDELGMELLVLSLSPASPISSSGADESESVAFEERRCRLGVTWMEEREVLLDDESVVGFGGAAAIGTTPALEEREGPVDDSHAVGVESAVDGSFDPEAEGGESESLREWALVEVGVVEGVTVMMEFLRDAFFAERVAAEPRGGCVPEPRFLFLMTSVLRDRGLTTP